MDIHPLQGKTILVLEDEPIVCIDVESLLHEQGARVLPAQRVRDAMLLANTCELSVALLDVNINGEDCNPVCAALAQRNVPMIFHTGYATSSFFNRWPQVSILPKPATPAMIVNAILAASNAVRPACLIG